MMRNTSNAQEKLKEEINGEEIMTALGLTYGKPEEVTTIMQEYYKGDKELVGQEFWEFLTGDPNAHKEVIEVMIEAREEVFQQQTLDDGDNPDSIQDAIEQKIRDLTEEWEEEYGEELSYDVLIEKFF